MSADKVHGLDRYYTVDDEKVQVYYQEGGEFNLVFPDDLPEPARSAFNRWLYGQTATLTPRGVAAYEHDFHSWLMAYKEGRVAPVTD